jgi:hypothetical protein
MVCDTLILQFRVLWFLQIYAPFLWSWPNGHSNKVTLNWFYVSAALHFPWISTLFFSPDYRNLPNIVSCTLVLRISYRKQRTSFPVSSHIWFTKNTQCHLVDAWLQVMWMHHVTSLRPSTWSDIWLPWSRQLMHTRPALTLMPLSITKSSLSLPYLISVPKTDHCNTAACMFT